MKNNYDLLIRYGRYFLPDDLETNKHIFHIEIMTSTRVSQYNLSQNSSTRVLDCLRLEQWQHFHQTRSEAMLCFKEILCKITPNAKENLYGRKLEFGSFVRIWHSDKFYISYLIFPETLSEIKMHIFRVVFTFFKDMAKTMAWITSASETADVTHASLLSVRISNWYRNNSC